jgi:predicted CoA-binding protein
MTDTDAIVERILTTYNTIAVVGASAAGGFSPSPSKSSSKAAYRV